jgi:hypothetical protein
MCKISILFVFSLEPSKHQIIKCGSCEVPDVYEMKDEIKNFP